MDIIGKFYYSCFKGVLAEKYYNSILLQKLGQLYELIVPIDMD
jgi:hypothetical protein